MSCQVREVSILSSRARIVGSLVACNEKRSRGGWGVSVRLWSCEGVSVVLVVGWWGKIGECA